MNETLSSFFNINISDKEYDFKCSWSKPGRDHPCKGSHILIFNELLINQLINNIWECDLGEKTIEFVQKIVSDFEAYVEEEYQKVLVEPWSHWSSIDVNAEMIYGFRNKYFDLKFDN
jgi:hypothetical protein